MMSSPLLSHTPEGELLKYHSPLLSTIEKAAQAAGKDDEIIVAYTRDDGNSQFAETMHACFMAKNGRIYSLRRPEREQASYPGSIANSTYNDRTYQIDTFVSFQRELRTEFDVPLKRSIFERVRTMNQVIENSGAKSVKKSPHQILTKKNALDTLNSLNALRTSEELMPQKVDLGSELVTLGTSLFSKN